MLYGTVRKLVPERGFGFILPDRGPDIYFHASSVEEGKFDFIQPDQAVMYELVPRDREAKVEEKPRAAKVKLIDRIPGGILPAPTQALAPKHHPRSRQRKPTWRGPTAGGPATDGAGGDAPGEDKSGEGEG